MRLGVRIFVCYLAIFAACLYFPVNRTLKDLRTRYQESLEEPLVDAVNLMAVVLEDEMARADFRPQDLQASFARAHERLLAAQIYDLQKTTVDTHLYVTDAAGRVVFDTRTPSAVGQDYSNWRDVRLTLDGRYGARTTLQDANDIFSSALYIAAPLYRQGQMAGVVTLVKSTTNIQQFLRLARPGIVEAGLLSLAGAAVLSLAVSYWLTRPIGRLARYADAIGEGRRPPFPDLGRTEVADLGQALRRMQEALEGRRYAEEYVQTLTHELKSPISGIRGAVELLQEDIPAQQQMRFLANIRVETERIGRIIERMLELATLENRREKPEMAPALDVAAMINTVVEGLQSETSGKDLQVEISVSEGLTVKGNEFLLHQALANLMQNAIDFSPHRGKLTVTAAVEGGQVAISFADEGPGVPAYAQSRIFDRFYSLARPGTGKKSTGLGLNFVREVAQLHDGTIRLTNRAEGGVLAQLTLPRGD